MTVFIILHGEQNRAKVMQDKDKLELGMSDGALLKLNYGNKA